MDRVPSSHLLLWTLLAGSWFVFAVWHSRENRELLRKMGIAGFDAIFVAQMVKFAWSRSAQQLLIVFAMMASLIVYDWQYLKLKTSPLFSLTLTDPGYAIATAPQQQPQLERTWQQAAAPAASAEAYANLAPAAGGTIPPATPPVQQDIEALQRAGLVQQVYEPARASAEPQGQLDVIKQNYEELFITFFFLRNCGIARDEDYHILHSALAQQLASLDAESRLQNDILLAAEGSYREVYSKISCDSQDLEQMGQQFHNYTDDLARNFSQATP